VTQLIHGIHAGEKTALDSKVDSRVYTVVAWKKSKGTIRAKQRRDSKMEAMAHQRLPHNHTDRPQLLKIGEISRRSGVGIETLRFYEKSGLLDKPARTESGYRVYAAEVLERLAFIKQAQSLGFTLEEIRRVIEDARAGQSPCDEVREIVRRRLAELDARMRELRRYRKELAATLAEWERVGRAPGHICGLIEGTEIKHGGAIPHSFRDAKPAGAAKQT
jgi:DNA-binding transcriptional MerR regulator